MLFPVLNSFTVTATTRLRMLAVGVLLAGASSIYAESNGTVESTAPASTAPVTTAPAGDAGSQGAGTGARTVDPGVQQGSDGVKAPPKPADPFNMSFLLIMAVPLALMWFMASRTQKKEAKRQEDLRSGLKRGDQVVTIGGAHAEVVSVGEATVDLRLGKGDEATVVTFNKSAIGSVGGAQAAADVGKAK